MPLCLVIIGAGLAGLSAAIAAKIANPQTDVLILETVSSLNVVGVRNYQTSPRLLVADYDGPILGRPSNHAKLDQALPAMGHLRAGLSKGNCSTNLYCQSIRR